MIDNFFYALTIVGCLGLAFRQQYLALAVAYLGFTIGYAGLMAQFNGWFK